MSSMACDPLRGNKDAAKSNRHVAIVQELAAIAPTTAILGLERLVAYKSAYQHLQDLHKEVHRFLDLTPPRAMATRHLSRSKARNLAAHFEQLSQRLRQEVMSEVRRVTEARITTRLSGISNQSAGNPTVNSSRVPNAVDSSTGFSPEASNDQQNVQLHPSSHDSRNTGQYREICHGLFIDEDRSDVTTCYENYVANSHFRSWLDLILRMSS
ncbi:hypothetical protein C1H76_8102 [Elsinoe australis]|uniref:Uncharacterized protein n=1 Tax=Elsinoe australis TaxID=40998 RepID=A0A4U7AW33_9PEZI|nr:hypothetical protein C1H76_8102 [Elsinoe australis]